jgi:hypothetical protein
MPLRYIQRLFSVHIMYLRMKQESDCLPHVGHRYRVREKQSNTSKTRWVCQQIELHMVY